jgi:hypothetical protein
MNMRSFQSFQLEINRNQEADMKSNYIRLDNPVAPNVSHCFHKPAVGGTSRTVVDDSGFLAITAWTCPECGEVIEEVNILTREGKVQPRAMRYAVTYPHSGSQAPSQDAHRRRKVKMTVGIGEFL